MIHILGSEHFGARQALARLNAAIVLGLVCTGLLACMLGASVYDVGRLFSAW